MKLPNFLLKMQRISATNKIFLLQNLSVMVKTGIALAEALDTLAQQIKNKKLKNILLDITDNIKKGKSFGESLEPHQREFGDLFVNMVKSGEAGGKLEEVLKQLYVQTKKDHELVMKVRHALTYPVIIIVAMIGIGIFMVTFVLPNITKLFKDLDVQLPLFTRLLIALSDFVQAHGLVVALASLLTLIIFIRLAKTERGQKIIDLLFLKLPLISTITKKINLARISRNLSSLIKTDIAIVESINITARIIGNAYYRQALIVMSERVKKGEKMADILKNYPKIFPATITQIIAVGEETGAVDEVLENLADFYEDEVYQTMNTLPTIIEPILMLLIGFGVAGIALAIMMPMYSLTQSF